MIKKIEFLNDKLLFIDNQVSIERDESVDTSKVKFIFTHHRNILISGFSSYLFTTILVDEYVDLLKTDGVDVKNEFSFLFIEDQDPMKVGYLQINKGIKDSPQLYSLLIDSIDNLRPEILIDLVKDHKINHIIWTLNNDETFFKCVREDIDVYIEILNTLRKELSIPIICVVEEDDHSFFDGKPDYPTELMDWCDCRISTNSFGGFITGRFSKPEYSPNEMFKVQPNGIIEYGIEESSLINNKRITNWLVAKK